MSDSAASMAHPSPVSDEASTSSASAERDSFLDLLRGVSICRVVILHTLIRPPVVYLPWIMWLYPGMPEVFFVSGAVTARMLRRRPTRTVVIGRIRRIALPYAFYACVALAVMAVTDQRSASPGASVPWAKVWHWLVPLLAPVGSTDRVILWGQLWYIGAFVWLVFAAPLLFAAQRRAGAWIALIPLAGFAFCLWLEKIHHVHVDEAIFSACQFGVFFALGPSYDRLRQWSTRWLAGLAGVLGALGVSIAFVIEPIVDKGTQELYASRSAHLCVGAAWMLLALSAQHPIRRWLNRHPGFLRTVIARLNQRTLTMYLWGLPANAVANAASRKIGGAAGNLAVYLVVTVVAFVVFVTAFGWLEDLAARRRPRLLPAARAA